MHPSSRISRALLAALSLVALSGAADAKRLIFRFVNESGSPIDVQLYAGQRSHVWPGVSESWSIPPNKKTYSEPIACERGEKICFGAWVHGREDINYGVARNNVTRCENCCYTCKGTYTRIITFNPPNLAVSTPDDTAAYQQFHPSFDCSDSTLNAAERTICSSAALSHADNQLSALYDLLLNKYTSSRGRPAVRQSQRAFLERRNACGADVSCLTAAYAARQQTIRDLGIYENVNVDE
jgi:uncharacterized protein YecT (DUF1311 family)